MKYERKCKIYFFLVPECLEARGISQLQNMTNLDFIHATINVCL